MRGDCRAAIAGVADGAVSSNGCDVTDAARWFAAAGGASTPAKVSSYQDNRYQDSSRAHYARITTALH